jgi:hypothetical protein
LFNLIVLDCGSVLDSWLFNSRPSAVHGLSDWCRDNWHDEDSDPDDFDEGNEGLIDYFFENWEDYSWCISEIKVPSAVPVGDEILLTPGRCRVVREALGNFEFGLVGIIMAEENELLVGDAAEFEKVIEDMIKEFE